MKSFTELMQPESFYHIYNRGVNGCNLFLTDSNYRKFMGKYAEHTEHILDTYTYCLLKNHFHLLARIKSEAEIRGHYSYMGNKNIEQIVSSQLAHLFNGYAQYFNLKTQRTGKLFELPFRRKPVTSNEYLSRLIYYIHANPKTHGLIKDFKEYKYSSFQSLLSDAPTKLAREELLKWFGGKEGFLKFHQGTVDLSLVKGLIIEV